MPKTTVADTSLRAYRNNTEELETLKDKTFAALEKFHLEHKFWPTYNELKQYMTRKYGVKNYQQVQPRLTNDLVDDNKVERHKERTCKVSGETIMTWKVKQ